MERYTVREIANACGISNATFYNWINQNKELKAITRTDKEERIINGAKSISYGSRTYEAFITEAKRRGKTVNPALDKDATDVRQTETKEKSFVPPSADKEIDNDETSVRQTEKSATQMLIEELKAQNEYLKSKLDEALADNRAYSQTIVKMSANLVLLQSENQRLLEAQTAEPAANDDIPAIINEEDKNEPNQSKNSLWQRITNRWKK